jgi:hypothetical protein
VQPFARLPCLLIFLSCFGAANAKYLVSRVFYEYSGVAKNLPKLAKLRTTFVSLGNPEEEISLDALIDGRTKIRSLTDRDIFKLSEIPLQYLKFPEVEGIKAFPSPEDIHPVSGKDLRMAGDTSLTIRITVPHTDIVSARSISHKDSAATKISKQVEPIKAEYLVSRVFYEYSEAAKNLPELSKLRSAIVSLGDPDEKISLDALIDGRTKIRILTDRDLFKLSEIPLQYLKFPEVEGIKAFPSPEDIHPVSGKDLRMAGDTSLTIRITVPHTDIVSARSISDKDSAAEKISKQVEPIKAEYMVSRVFYQYTGIDKNLPELSKLRSAIVSLGDPGEKISLDSLIDGRTKIRNLTDRDLFKLSEVPLQYLKSFELEGIVAYPSPEDIHPVSGLDLRESGDTSLTINIMVSHLGSVSVNSKSENNSSAERISRQILNYLEKKEFVGKPIKKELIDTLRLYSSHRSRSAKVHLSAREEPGVVDAVLSLNEDLDRPRFLLSAANTGKESTGEWIFSGTYFNDQLTGMDDTLGVSYMFSNTMERHAFNTSYYLPFFPEKTLGMGLSLGYSTYDASTFSVTEIDFEGDSFFLDLALDASPVSLIEESISLGFEAGLNLENVSAFNSITGSASLVNITPRLGITLHAKQKNRTSRSSIVLKGNVNSISESDQLVIGGLNTSDTYGRVILRHYESWKIARMLLSDSGPYLDRHLFSAKFEANWSLGGQRHLPAHQFIAGGSHSVRGYPEFIAAGDSGYLISLEYRIPFYLSEEGESRELNAFSIIPFFDFGSTHVNRPFAYEEDHNLVGLGLGLEFQLPYGAYARVDFAKPLNELSVIGVPIDGTVSDDYRIHGNIRWKF